ncbi:MAG: hypothetical protein IKK66_10540 [Ruminococcus sp.]|nr:hypothetical protein [Ruminococcus sp.]
MRHKKFLSILAAAAMAATPVSFNVYAEGGEEIKQPTQSGEGILPDGADEPITLTTAPVTTKQTVTTTTVTTGEKSTVTTSSVTTQKKPVTTTSSVTKTKLTTTTTKVTTVPATTTAPVETAIKVEPVCEHINKADINGRILVDVPEGATANISIEYSSPEYDAHEYYNTHIKGGEVYAFDVEGRDVSDDDYRIYKIMVTVTGGKYNITADAYADSFTIPDGNDNPDSFREISYKFTIDDDDIDSSWTVVKDTDKEKEIAVHLDYVMIGDVNNDSTVDASDASMVLAEYSRLSTGGSSTLSDKQIIAANVNRDSAIDAADASDILVYYSITLTGGTPSWDK